MAGGGLVPHQLLIALESAKNFRQLLCLELLYCQCPRVNCLLVPLQYETSEYSVELCTDTRSTHVFRDMVLTFSKPLPFLTNDWYANGIRRINHHLFERKSANTPERCPLDEKTISVDELKRSKHEYDIHHEEVVVPEHRIRFLQHLSADLDFAPYSLRKSIVDD